MLLIAAALAEELEPALNLCVRRSKTRCAGVPMWSGERGGSTFRFVKLGAGPVRSASVLEHVLTEFTPAAILNIGYAGALDPALKQGDLVIVDRADLLSFESPGIPLEDIELGGGWQLAGAGELLRSAQVASLPACRGSALTSRCIIGDPEHKRLLFRKFQAAIVDMETAALARVAARATVPFSGVRAISDEADDDFLASFSYDPHAGSLRRTAKVVADGRWLQRYGVWRKRSLAARQALARFLASYLDGRHL